MPFQPLGGGGMVGTVHTLVAARSVAQVTGPPKYRQIAHLHPIIIAMKLANCPPALPAARFLFRTFHRDNYFPVWVDFGLQHAHIGYLQGQRDLCFCHSHFTTFSLYFPLILPPLLPLYIAPTTLIPKDPQAA